MPFLDLLLVGPAKELLHGILEVEGVLIASNFVAAGLIVCCDVSIDGAFLRLDEVVVILILHLLFLNVFLLMLFLVFYIFFLVILRLNVVIIESIIDLCQNICLKPVQIRLGNHVLALLWAERLWHWHGAQVGLPSDKVRGSEGLLEVGDLLLEYGVFTE